MFSLKDYLNNPSKSFIIDNQYKYIQYSKEKSYYESSKIVKLSKFDKDLVSKANEKQLVELVKQKFYNGEIMELFSYYTNLLVRLSGQEESVQDFFTNPKRIGSDSVKGIAFKANLKDISDMFVLKVPKEEDLIHEFFVGTHLNNLRGQVLNFSYIYGAFDCNFPELIEKNIYNVCSNKINIVNYIIQENIRNNISFREFSATCSFKNFILVYLQVVLAIAYANDIYQYTHYDLHYDNVLIVESSYEVVIPYPYKSDIIYIKTKYVPFIIDYGFSHLRVDNYDYSYNGRTKIGNINLYISNPLQDFFKLLTTLAISSKPENYNKGIHYLLTYFIKDISPNRDIAMQQLNEIYKSTSFYLLGDVFPDHHIFVDYLLNIIFNFYPEVSYSYDSIYPLLGCSDMNICETKQVITQQITNVNNPINVIYEIFRNAEDRKSILTLTDKENFIKNSDYFINFIDKNIIEYNQKRAKFYLPDITTINDIRLFTNDMLNIFDTGIKFYYEIYDLIKKILYQINIIIYLIKYFNITNFKNYMIILDKKEKMENEKKIFIIDNENFVLNNIKHFKELVKTQTPNVKQSQIKIFNSLNLFSKA